MKQQIIDAFVSLKETDESTYQKRLGKYNELKELYLEKLKKHRKNAQGSKVSEASKQHHETMRSVKGQIHSHIKDILNQVQRDDEVPADG